MNINRENASVNHQDHPRSEGQQSNTPPIHEADGQRRSDNRSQPMSNMMQDEKDNSKSEKRESRTDSEQQGERQQ